MGIDYSDGDKQLAAEKPGTEVKPTESVFDKVGPIGEMPNALDAEKALPPPMLLRGSDGCIVPHGHVTLLAACGGTGKSFLTLQLAASVATGKPWLSRQDGEQGFVPNDGNPGKVLLWSAEDSWEIANYRLTHIAGHLRLDPEKVGSNIIGLFGKARILATKNEGGDLEPTPDYDGLCRAIRRDDFALVVIDSLALVSPGDTEKDNLLAHKLLREYLAEISSVAEGKRSPAIVVTHHTTKPSGRDKPDQHSIRGASGIVNGARDALLLTPLEIKEGHPPLIHWKQVKQNLAAWQPDRFLMWAGHSANGSGCPYLCTAKQSIVDDYHASANEAARKPKQKADKSKDDGVLKPWVAQA